jgi:hypothetical protein
VITTFAARWGEPMIRALSVNKQMRSATKTDLHPTIADTTQKPLADILRETIITYKGFTSKIN